MSARHEEAQKKRGTKRTCEADDCGRRFYDLNKLPTDCPYCGTHFAVPVPRAIDPTAYVPRVKPRYTLQQPVAEPFEPSPAAELPVDEIEADAPDAVADEIPEIDEPELEEEIVDVKERDDL